MKSISTRPFVRARACTEPGAVHPLEKEAERAVDLRQVLDVHPGSDLDECGAVRCCASDVLSFSMDIDGYP